jgi:hypothetical protein
MISIIMLTFNSFQHIKEYLDTGLQHPIARAMAYQVSDLPNGWSFTAASKLTFVILKKAKEDKYKLSKSLF